MGQVDILEHVEVIAWILRNSQLPISGYTKVVVKLSKLEWFENVEVKSRVFFDDESS